MGLAGDQLCWSIAGAGAGGAGRLAWGPGPWAEWGDPWEH